MKTKPWINMPRPDNLATRSVDITYRIFRFLRLSVRHDAEMMDLTIVSRMIADELPSFKDEQQIWLANLEKEG